MNEFVSGMNSAGGAFVAFAIRMLVQSSVLILILLILDRLLRRRVRAVVRYWIWMLVLVKLLLPPSLSSPTSLAWWLGDKLPQTPLATVDAPPEPREEVLLSSPPALETMPREIAMTQTAIDPATSPAAPISDRVNPATVPAPVAPTWQALVLAGWLIVVAVMLALLAQRALFVRRLVAQSQDASERMLSLLDRCRRQMRVRTPVRLRVTSVSASPSVCGLVRPTILIPQGMLIHLDSGQWKSILLHELAHLRRADLWVNLAQTLLQIAYVYNPLLWLANATIRKVREQAVDETVLAAMGDEAEEYPRTLLNISKLAFGRPSLTLRLTGVVESKRTLIARIRHIASRPFPTTARLGLAGVVLVLAVGAALLPMAKAEPQEKTAGDRTPTAQTTDAPEAPNTPASNSPETSLRARSTDSAKTVEGIVTDPLGRPRQCVYVATQGQNIWRGTMSDAEGRFKLENVRPDQTVWIAYSQASRLYGFLVLPATTPGEPIKVILNLGEADLEGRVVGADGKPVANRKVEIVVTTSDGIRFPLDYQPETDAYGYYSHSSVPSSEGLVIDARLVETNDSRESFATTPMKIRVNQSFIELPVLVAARQKIQPDFDRNMKDDGMLHCSGQVLNEAGKAIPGVRVHLSFDMPGHMSTWIRDAMTDEQGRWRRSIPPECMGLTAEFRHTEYYLDESRGNPSREELAAGAHIITMKHGLRLDGKVTNEQGEPVENALVCGSRTSSATPSPYNQIIEDSGMARTLRDGTFCIRGLSPGARNIIVYPDHYAPTIQPVDIREGMAPVCVMVKTGRTYRGQVVDARGAPMEGIRIGTSRWEVGKEWFWMSRLSTTDVQGMFALTNLPEGQLRITFGRKKGYLGFSKDLAADLSQTERVVMYNVPTFTGRVVDADTNEPVTDFKVVNGVRWDKASSLDWSRYYGDSIKDPNGAFTREWAGYAVSSPSSVAACIKIEARGYVTSDPVLLELGQACPPLIIRLKKGTPLAGIVLQPDGVPAVQAQVALVREGERAFIDRDQFSADSFAQQAEIVTTTDAEGRFELPPGSEQGLLVAVQRTGYAQLQSTAFSSGASIRLLAWSRVEGVIDRSGVAEKEIEVALYTLGESSDRRTPGIYWLTGRMTPTGNTFTVECVPIVPLAVGRISRYEMHDAAYLVPEPGETCQVKIRAHGRRVIGRIVPPHGLPQNQSVALADPRRVHAVAFRADAPEEIPAAIAVIDEQSFNWLWQDKEDAYRPSTTLRKRHIPTIQEDGSFAFDGLAPGTYEFVVNYHAPLGENVSCGRGVLQAVAVSRFTVPDGKAATALSAPDVHLSLLTYPKAGEAAPLFEAGTFDGDTIRLADFRGKVVLLDFWATWCRPCVAQLPQMQQLHEEFKADGRFVMIGMSLDWDLEKARGFLAEKQLKWPQASLGNMDTSTIVKQYGVGSIPETILIDPQGKILAMGGEMDELRQKVRQALSDGARD
ncbi:MAG: M56 family metallopeptidase [Phycisphaerales bacterium]